MEGIAPAGLVANQKVDLDFVGKEQTSAFFSSAEWTQIQISLSEAGAFNPKFLFKKEEFRQVLEI